MFRRFLELLLGLDPATTHDSTTSVDDLLLSPRDRSWDTSDYGGVDPTAPA